MPAVVNMSVGSPCGTSGEDGTSVCPCWTKKSRKARRSSAPVLSELVGDIHSPGAGSPGRSGAAAGTGHRHGTGGGKVAESAPPPHGRGRRGARGAGQGERGCG